MWNWAGTIIDRVVSSPVDGTIYHVHDLEKLISTFFVVDLCSRWVLN